MYCLFIYESGNHAYKALRALERSGKDFEVIAIPCAISKYGCGECLKGPCDLKDMVASESINLKIPVKEIYKVSIREMKKKYERIFP